MRVSKKDVADVRKQISVGMIQILKEPATGLSTSMSQSGNNAVQSSLQDGGVKQVADWSSGHLVMKFGSIAVQPVRVPHPVKHVAMQKYVDADSPEGGTPREVWIPVAERRKQF